MKQSHNTQHCHSERSEESKLITHNSKFLILFFAFFLCVFAWNQQATAQRSFSIGSTILTDSSTHLILRSANLVIEKDTVVIGQMQGANKLMLRYTTSTGWTWNAEQYFTNGLRVGAELHMNGEYLYFAGDPQSHIEENVEGTRNYNLPSEGEHIFNVDGSPKLTITEDGTQPTRLLGLKGTATNNTNLLTLTTNYAIYEASDRVEWISNVGWTSGSIITIISTGACDFVHDEEPSTQPQTPLFLLGSTTYSTPGIVAIQLVLDLDQGYWYEISRIEY